MFLLSVLGFYALMASMCELMDWDVLLIRWRLSALLVHTH
jgi:hypothetical protein